MIRTRGISMLAAAALLGFRVYEPLAEPAVRWCGFYWLTRLPCPLCGLTRGLCAAAKGDWAAAAHYHAFSPPGLVLLAVIALAGLMAPRWDAVAWLTSRRVARPSLLAVLAYGVARWVI